MLTTAVSALTESLTAVSTLLGEEYMSHTIAPAVITSSATPSAPNASNVGMTSIATTHSGLWSPGAQQCFTGRFSEGRRQGYAGSLLPYKSNICPSRDVFYYDHCQKSRKHHVVCSSSVNKNDAVEPEDENSETESSNPENQLASNDSFRDNLERIIGVDD